MNEALKAKVAALPRQPGCYLFKDHHGDILYVGKAVVLRNRVRSYFQKSVNHSPKTVRMVRKIHDLEWIVTDSELEALILECSLIKRHRPPYNVLMKDDKTYPYLAVTLGEKYPRLMVTRRVRKDGSRYFGPFANAGAVWSTHDLLHRTFPLIPCGKVWSGEPVQRPCLYHHMGRCLAPCAGLVDQETYRGVIQNVTLFLEGKGDDLLKQLGSQMEQAAESLEFERAAKLRDQIRALEEVLQRQKVVNPEGADEDVVAMVKDERGACVQMFYIRGGKLIGQRHFLLDSSGEENPGEIVQAFLKQYYQDAPEVPEKILLPLEIEELNIVNSWLKQRRGASVEMRVPHRGEDAKLLELASKNAELALLSMRQQMDSKADWGEAAMAELQDALGLPKLPQRIECYDISNIQGTAPVGSMVVFENGMAKKSDYRRFRIRWHPEDPDDYAMMREVITRRLREAMEAEEAKQAGKGSQNGWANLPDLMLIDGGKGQLNAALEAMRALGFELPAAGLAKKMELVILPEQEEPVALPTHSKALHLLQRARDEAHRFALTYHRKIRDKRATKSVLEEIPGVGPRRRRMLLRLFGSVDKIKEASVEEIASAPTMTHKLAEQILAYLKS
ncbi:MAG: excinuclease ABC subunit UvrC [Fimbriimonadia bacterium]|nr:excinuclease ABC subunit UvrC [Fimbriimonadia bacterium]